LVPSHNLYHTRISSLGHRQKQPVSHQLIVYICFILSEDRICLKTFYNLLFWHYLYLSHSISFILSLSLTFSFIHIIIYLSHSISFTFSLSLLIPSHYLYLSLALFLLFHILFLSLSCTLSLFHIIFICLLPSFLISHFLYLPLSPSFLHSLSLSLSLYVSWQSSSFSISSCSQVNVGWTRWS